MPFPKLEVVGVEKIKSQKIKTLAEGVPVKQLGVNQVKSGHFRKDSPIGRERWNNELQVEMIVCRWRSYHWLFPVEFILSTKLNSQVLQRSGYWSEAEDQWSQGKEITVVQSKIL